MKAKRIISSVLESEPNGHLGIKLALLGDPFNEDPKINFEKYKILWAHVRSHMPGILKDVDGNIDHLRRLYKSGKVVWDLHIPYEYELHKRRTEDFLNKSYNMMHTLIDEASLPPLGECEMKTFHQISEIMMDDIHDFLGMQTS